MHTDNSNVPNTSFTSSVSPSHSVLDHHGNTIGIHSARNRSSLLNPNLSENVLNEKNLKLTKGPELQKNGLFKTTILTLVLVLVYYLTSIGLTFYQKWLLKVII